MDGSKLYGAASNIAVLIRNQTLPSPPDLLESFWIPDSSTTFHGVEGDNTKDRLLFQAVHEEENGEDDLHRAEKKRRLTAGQVQLLERNFEVENKLEPERKNQLAKELGLQPRQVAIWFQNRRARFKTKQLEKDYDSLKASYDTLKAHYDLLLKDKEKLTTEVLLLTEKMLKREKTEAGEDMIIISPSQKAIPKAQAILFCKQEDAASSAKSDVFDPDSPLGNHSSLLEAEQSEFSQDEEDNLNKTLMMPPTLFFPKLEDCSYSYPDPDPDPDPPANASCNIGGWPAPEEQPIWFWSY